MDKNLQMKGRYGLNFKHKKTDYLVRPANSGDIAEAISSLYKNLRMAKKICENGYNKVRMVFNNKEYTKKLDNIYSNLVGVS